MNNAFSFHATSVDEAAKQLESDIAGGLTALQAKDRLKQFGRNSIVETSSTSGFHILIRQFKSPIVLLLLFAGALSAWFNDWLNAIAILIVIIINAGVGFFMEFKAHASMRALKKLSCIPGKVIRDGRLSEVDSEEIVPGDLLFCEAGDLIAADGRIVKPVQLLVDESALTGESVPVEKGNSVLPEATILADRTNMVFKGTYVSKGNAFILVCATGMGTELGKIAELVSSSAPAATPLENRLEEFSKKLIRITLALVILIFLFGLINGQPIVGMLQTAIALSVAAIPEGLPIVATMSLAIGMLKMSRHRVIVKKLSAVETLGGTNVICTDKTGTLTQNKMEVVFVSMPTGKWEANKPFRGDRQHLQLVIDCAVLCNTAHLEVGNAEVKEIGDPLEIALLKFAEQNQSNIQQIRHQFVKVHEEPFSSETKMMATLHEHEGAYYSFVKGAAEEVLLRCSHLDNGSTALFDTSERASWMSLAEEFATSGHRMIALAYRRTVSAPPALANELVFLGLVGIIDPPRPEVLSAIQDCKRAGIRVVMITGDHPSTAHSIGTELGISRQDEVPVTGREMKEYQDLTEDEKIRWINTSVFARVNPKHKLDLVSVFQEKGFVVGMTGDGVNDAPALKKSDIGIAMGLRGTQVAQEVADMVLKDDSFTSIIVAIKQGRIIFENIRKFVTFLLSCNLSELLVIALAAVMNLHFQLMPLQILFINLITDVLPALALGLTKGGAGVMEMPPRKSADPIIDSTGWKTIFLYSAAIAIVSSAAVLFNHFRFHSTRAEAAICNNVLFFTLILSQLLHVFNMGNRPLRNNEVIQNKYVWYSVILSLSVLFGLIQISFVRQALNVVTLSLQDWTLILASSMFSVIVIQAFKHFQKFQSNGQSR